MAARPQRMLLAAVLIGIGLGRNVLTKVTANPESFVLVKSDQGVKYRMVIDVLDELLQAGITNIALPTEEEVP